MKPLFIALNTEHFDAFASGIKTNEFRLYGPRWNHRTCVIGREVILSKGYGRQNRMIGTIAHFNKFDARGYEFDIQQTILKIFGTLDKPIAQIGIANLKRIIDCGASCGA